MSVAVPRLAALPVSVAEALARGATVLTPNQRAAHALRLAYDEEQLHCGRTQWTPAQILPLDAWMPQLWHRMLLAGEADRVLLNSAQEHVLWKGLIDADKELSTLRSSDPLADMAANAWRLLHRYQAFGRMKEAAGSADSRAFQRWARALLRVLDKHSYLTAAQLPDTLRAALTEGDLPLPDAGLLLLDFDTLPPAIAALFDSMRQAGYQVLEERSSVAAAAPQQLYEAVEERSEMDAAAAWCRIILEGHPAARIAVIVPDLAQRRARIERAFTHCFDAFSDTVQTPFEFSLGSPLAETPMVTAALDLLRWSIEPLPLTAIGELLLSPFVGAFGSQQERLAAAEMDVALLRQQPLLRPELSLESTVTLIESSPYATRAASLLHRLRALLQQAKTARLSADYTQSHSDWANLFRRLLEAAGWSRNAHGQSLWWQTHTRWEGVLDELATLDFDGTRPDAAGALATVTRLAQQATFAPLSTQAPVQIIGPLEVGGVPFDALWFLGAGNLTWPQRPATSALLPWQLQRACAMPGADPAREHSIACRLTARIASSAAHSVFSFARQTDAGEQRRSPALGDLSLDALEPAIADKPPQPQILEDFVDQSVIPFPPDAVSRGGAHLLQLQAACGFRAFAEHRLYSAEPAARSPGLDALERGNLVHRVMEHVWNQLPSQDHLRALSLERRQAALADGIDHALQRFLKKAGTAWDKAYLDLQRRRLHNLLLPWLDVELDRPRFTVHQNESPYTDASLGPLRLSLRVDRVDQTSEGPVILDYKTGNASPNQWLGDRPDAPQLPLYAILFPEPPAGVAFALLRAGDELALKGFADSADAFGKPAKMPLSMAEQVEQWRETLTALATSFYRGDADPDPKSYPGTCSHCAQRILCRLNPASLRPGSEDEPDEETQLG